MPAASVMPLHQVGGPAHSWRIGFAVSHRVFPKDRARPEDARTIPLPLVAQRHVAPMGTG